jgi:calreticulin
MKAVFVLAALLGLVAFASATVYFQEDFSDDWTDRWVYSTVDDEKGTAGKFTHTAGLYFNDAEKDKGIQTSTDARFYKASAKFPKFSNKDKTLVVQYSVKNEQQLDCGGGYIKLGPVGLDQTKFEGESPYNIMFGPDKCGATNRVHFILNYKGQNHLIKKEVTPNSDTYTHLYTAILYPDQTYEIRVDNEKKQSGSLLDDWDFLPPKEIPDPSKPKPADWVDEKEIADPEAKKPEGWDDIPQQIADPDAKKPEDWDDELDGDWEAPVIENPEYKGEWHAPMIPNPAYKGEYVQPLIANPDYAEDKNIYAFEHEWVGFELWQVKSGTIFDHILITDDIAEAESFATGYFKEQQKGEKEQHEKQEEERRQKEEEERKKREAEEKANQPAADEQEDADEDDDEDDKEDKERHDEL